MWLINVKTRELEQVIDEHQQAYAILSHTWGRNKVTFEQMKSGDVPAGEAYAKVDYTCCQALDDGISHAWVDTCCIDKRSSAELSEAINSMFSYYRQAAICYVYLFDVPEEAADCVDTVELVRQLEGCRWFTRGWTLQEMLAPLELHFYGSGWTYIGDKKALRGALRIITRIDQAAIDDYILHNYRQKFSIAQKMSWAATRATTRLEDRAYSLLGLFDVNIPLIYGEREKAFARLQKELMRRSPDSSVFAWHGHLDVDSDAGSLLASSPDNFAQLSDIVSFGQVQDQYQMNSQGLQLRARIFRDPSLWVSRCHAYALLHCRYAGDFSGPLGLSLSQLSDNGTEPAVFCVKDNGTLLGSHHGRIALIPQELVERANLTSGIILRNTGPTDNTHFDVTLDVPEAPQVWVRVVDARTGWSDECRPFPEERWLGTEVFVLDPEVDREEESIGCKVLTPDLAEHDGTPFAVAFGVKYFPYQRLAERRRYYSVYQIRLGIGSVDETSFDGALNDKRPHMGFAKSLLADSTWSDEPSVSWVD